MPPEKEIFTLEQIIQNRKKRLLEIMKKMNRKTEMELEKEIKELEKELIT